MDRRPDLSLNEWAVLGVLAEHPRHGYEVAAILGPGTPLGDVWRLTRTKTYRALERLDALDAIEARRIEPGDAAPHRTVWAPTRTSRARLKRWLHTPVEHLRDVRSELLLKLMLLDRIGLDRAGLIDAQRQVFAPMIERLQANDADDPAARWRYHAAQATAAFLDDLR